MYQFNKAITALSGRVGFRQPTQADYAGVFDTANSTSASGQFFDDFHAAVTVQALREVVINEANASNVDFNKYVTDLKTSAISSMLDTVFAGVDLIEQNIEFNIGDNRPAIIPNTGRFVGRSICIAKDSKKTVKINSITLFFDGAATFNLYLFNKVLKSPVKTLSVTTDSDSQVVVIPEDWLLNFTNGTAKSGEFFIGYFQDDLGSVQAYDEQFSCWNTGLIYGSSCIEANRVPSEVNFDRYQPARSSRTYGLNIDYSSLNDFTEAIVRNPAIFDQAIGYQMAGLVVEKCLNTLRSNGTQRLSEHAYARLYNDLSIEMATTELPFSPGLRSKLNKEVKRLRETFFPKEKIVSQSISSSCSS